MDLIPPTDDKMALYVGKVGLLVEDLGQGNQEPSIKIWSIGVGLHGGAAVFRHANSMSC